MMAWQQRWAAIVLLATIVPVAAASAGQAYTWVDGQGVTHFSDTPPAGRADARAVELESSRPLPAGLDIDYYSIPNQARRLERSRLEMERARAEKLEVRSALRNASSGRYQDDAYRDAVTTYYGYSGGRYRPGRRGYGRLTNRGGYNAINGYAPVQSHSRSHRGRRSRGSGKR